MIWLIAIAIMVVLSLIWDLKQTLEIRQHPGYFELNRILGPHPSDVKVKLYFACVITIYLSCIAALKYFEIADEISLTWSAAWLAVEIWAIQNNLKFGL